MLQLTTGPAILYTVRMSRPFRTLCTFAFAVVSLVTLDGCRTRTVYTDVYSPRRSYFVPPVEKRIEPEVTAARGSSTAQSPVAQPAVPSITAPASDAPPAIPGMEQPAPVLPMAP